jgi:rhodanese-related sulfurtransferase
MIGASGLRSEMPMTLMILRILAAIACLALLGGTPATAKDSFTLGAVREKVKRDYDGVAQLSTGALADRLADREDVLLLDVREMQEFAVSHLAGAQRVDPGIWRSTFLKRFANAARGKTVVFYCSVGVRSSKLAEKVRAELMAQGALGVFNLDGGIFAWHNEGRPLVNAKGQTSFVHPYDSYWGQLITRRELAKTNPEP